MLVLVLVLAREKLNAEAEWPCPLLGAGLRVLLMVGEGVGAEKRREELWTGGGRRRR